ncbi:MAG: hypothetical protein ABH842_04775 [Candidatus Micrarchaeota archaeon]
MKYGLAILGVLFFVNLISATDCLDCDDLNEALQGKLFTLTHTYEKTIEIYAYYENNSAPDPRVALNNTAIIIEITNASNSGNFPQLHKVYTDQTGKAEFDFSEWADDSTSGCFNMKVLYCPFCTVDSSHCGFAECLSFSSIRNTSGYYSNIIGDIENIDDIEGPSAPAVVNNGTYLPQVTLVSFCSPPPPAATTPAFCLPLILVFALLGGALYLSGQNPFGVFNLGSPRVGRHIRYQARARGFSFSVMSVIQAAGSIASTVSQVKKAKAEAKKEGKSMSTGDAIKKVESNRASYNIIGASSVNRIKMGIGGFKSARAKAAAKGGTAQGQAMRSGQDAGTGGRGVQFLGPGQMRMPGEGYGNTGGKLMAKWGGGKGASGYFGKMAAGFTAMGVGLLSSLPIFYSFSAIATACGADTNIMARIERGSRDPARAQAELNQRLGQDGNPIITLSDGETEATMTMAAGEETTTVGLTAIPVPGESQPEQPPAEKQAQVTMDNETGEVKAVSYEAPATAKNPETGEATAGQKVAVSGTSGDATVKVEAGGTTTEYKITQVSPTPVTGAEADAVKALAAPGATPADGQTVVVVTAPDGGTKIRIDGGDQAGTYSVGADGSVARIQPDVITKTEPITGPAADQIRTLCSPTTGPLPEGNVSVVAGPNGEQQFKIDGGPNAGTYTFGADGSVTRIETVTGPAADAVKALAAPGLTGDGIIGGFKVGDTPTMPADRWAGQMTPAEIAKLEAQGQYVGDLQKQDTFLASCAETVIGVQEAIDHVKSTTQAAAGDRHDEIATAISAPEGKALLDAALDREATTAASLAFGKPVEPEEATKLTTGVAKTIEETDLYRGGFGADAVRTVWDEHNPVMGDDKRQALERAGMAIDQIVASLPVGDLAEMTPAKLQGHLEQRLGEGAATVLEHIKLDHVSGNIQREAGEFKQELTARLGETTASQLLSTPQEQFQILRESSNRIYEARADPSGTEAVSLVMRDPSKLPADLQLSVAEYHTYSAAATEAAMMSTSIYDDNRAASGDTTQVLKYGETQANIAPHLEEDVLHGAQMDLQRVMIKQVDTLDESNKALLPSEYGTMTRKYDDGFQQIGEANQMQVAFMSAGLLDPSNPSTSPTSAALSTALFTELEVNRALDKSRDIYQDLGVGGAVADTGPVGMTKVGTLPDIDYNAATAKLAQEAYRYHTLGMPDVAQAYTEVLHHVTEARDAPNSTERDEHLTQARQTLSIMSIAPTTPDQVGPQGHIYEAVHGAETHIEEAYDLGRQRIAEGDRYAEKVTQKVQKIIEKQRREDTERHGM